MLWAVALCMCMLPTQPVSLCCRAESAQALEAKIISVKKELSADYKRRLETMEAEWQTRSEGRLAEAEATYALKMQQVSNCLLLRTGDAL